MKKLLIAVSLVLLCARPAAAESSNLIGTWKQDSGVVVKIAMDPEGNETLVIAWSGPGVKSVQSPLSEASGAPAPFMIVTSDGTTVIALDAGGPAGTKCTLTSDSAVVHFLNTKGITGDFSFALTKPTTLTVTIPPAAKSDPLLAALPGTYTKQ